MDFYKIPEIRFVHYVECLEDIYDAKNTKLPIQDDEIDRFLRASLPFDQDAKRQKLLTMKWGYFHQNLAGKFRGYHTLKNGHTSGLDVIKDDGTEFWEWKNKFNTMNSASAKTTELKLLKKIEEGVSAFLVQVNCPNGKVNRHAMPNTIHVLNGKQGYAHISGRDTFFEDLLTTVEETFRRFKTFEEIVKFAELQPQPVLRVPRFQSACTEQPSLPKICNYQGTSESEHIPEHSEGAFPLGGISPFASGLEMS
jgi:hypothetical protein